VRNAAERAQLLAQAQCEGKLVDFHTVPTCTAEELSLETATVRAAHPPTCAERLGNAMMCVFCFFCIKDGSWTGANQHMFATGSSIDYGKGLQRLDTWKNFLSACVVLLEIGIAILYVKLFDYAEEHVPASPPWAPPPPPAVPFA
jgi:hypothetical protein